MRRGYSNMGPGPKYFWIFGTSDEQEIHILAFLHREDRDHHYGMLQTYGVQGWRIMGKTDRAVTMPRALSAMGSRFPGCTVHVRYPADEAADAADTK